MKNLYLLFCLLFFFLQKTEAQIYSPQLAGYNGILILTYPNGYFQGNVVNGVAQGEGLYYYYHDGSILKGNYHGGFLSGEAVFVTQYGYINSCWSNGIYVGNSCQNNVQTFNNAYVQNTLNQVNNNRRTNDEIARRSTSPEGYKINKIDPNTQMGRTLLGGIGGN
ncbi:hypothetical protein [Aequorivita marisscotiae]|uniref:MORN repeat protein n=1 Tax=Aequorivita marisscotiae TaxID=3040348 RepID=A0ABY8L053_9FLAO|nr:hypothetical protein [Aequorivita sp. Ant34-E75]WGF93342.1 hypothetical protein QCQ61_03920 [Aequorivita sp. Ant34-E75]